MSRTNKRVDENKKELIKNIKATFGNVGQACKLTGVSRTIYYHYLNTDPEFEQAVKDAEQDQIDYVESKLMEGVKKLDSSLIRFFLERRNPKFAPPKQTVEATGETSLFIKVVGGNLPTGEDD